ncbi:CRAL/TRIO domain-containing protein [Suhomyces tanzawaensis NRRL Y-17324]|uniref:CRAL/TRIO domain-containing protein n=1 Tax=Suhomyces tanzawaensis NRRL Y-17324 TaxID=984487 RepID=A0A1E4SCU6_9ASCO|nr:CRAL/TRIO domain-containing protein [Suhomyces tanzawaensis NRRL Y-17324]ODV77340.1 CRAL/TRIO domain-containing protein [Suhomyces tanzawaensis NRRL Y-17324]
MPTHEPVNWRPGRIQSLTGEQEVTLKQTWAYLLKYWGYDVAIADEDLAFKECFIASLSTSARDGSENGAGTNGLARTTTRGSINSAHTNKTSTSTLLSKKRRGLFGGSKKAPAAVVAAPPPDSKRMKQIQTSSSFERYSRVEEPSEKVYAAFCQFYKQDFLHSEDYVSEEEEDDESDTDSIESFVTASTSLTEPDDYYAPPNNFKSSPSNGYAQSNGQVSRRSSVSYKVPTPSAAPSKPARTASISRAPLSNIKITTNPGILSALAQYKPADLHDTLFSSMRNEMLDNFILRYVRARKWNTENAIQMLSKSLNWRRNEMSVVKWVNEGDALSYVTGTNKGFVKNLQTEKSWIRGHDRKGNPLFFFQARKHFAGDSPANETQRYAVTIVEFCRFFMRDTHDSADETSVIFDLTGFSLKNADYDSIKFLADIFEAHYPECLGAVMIFNAPWIFSTVWNLIKNWLDPVVASKIHFTKDFKELSQFVDPTFIPKDFGGMDNSVPTYPIPTKADTHTIKKKDENYIRIRKERDDLYMKLIETTIRWVESTNPAVSEQYYQDKIRLGLQLSDQYLLLDPYFRCPSIYDREGTLTMRT